jgi:hypothetical protein
MTRLTRADLLLWTLLAVTLTGCELRLDVEAELRRAGGGTMAVALTADRDVLTEARRAGVDPLGAVARAGDALDGWTVTDAQAPDGGRSVRLSATFQDEAAFERASADLAGALSAAEVELLEPFQVTYAESQVRLTGAASLMPTQAVRELGFTPAAAVRQLRRADSFDYAVAVTFPGTVLSASAGGRVQDRTVVWRVRPGQRLRIAAVADNPPPPVWPLVASGAAGGLLAGGVLWLWRRRRSRRGAADDDASDSAPPKPTPAPS